MKYFRDQSDLIFEMLCECLKDVIDEIDFVDIEKIFNSANNLYLRKLSSRHEFRNLLYDLIPRLNH